MTTVPGFLSAFLSMTDILGTRAFRMLNRLGGLQAMQIVALIVIAAVLMPVAIRLSGSVTRAAVAMTMIAVPVCMVMPILW